MIEIKLADNATKQKLNAENEVFVLFDGDEIKGWCEFLPTYPVGTIHKIECDDVPLIDGLLRQTLFYMAQKMCLTAELDKPLAEKLQSLFLIKKDSFEINIAEFFSKGCH